MKLESTLPMFILPALIIAASIVATTQYLSTDIIHMNSNIIAYADCAQNMMNYAFLGQVYNFSQCYLNSINQTYVNCYYNSTNIICNINETNYIYPLK